MIPCAQCGSLKGQIERAKREGNQQKVSMLTQVLLTHYAEVHQVERYPEIPGSERLFGVTVRMGK